MGRWFVFSALLLFWNCAEGRRFCLLLLSCHYFCVSLQYIAFILEDAYVLEVPQEQPVSYSMLLQCPKTMRVSTRVYI